MGTEFILIEFPSTAIIQPTLMTIQFNNSFASYHSPELCQRIFVGGLREIHWAQHRLIQTLLKLQNACTSRGLLSTLRDYTEITHKNVSKFWQIFELLDERTDGKKSEVMDNLCVDAEDMMDFISPALPVIRDEAILLGFEQINLYDVASYEVLLQLAHALEKAQIEEVLGEIYGEAVMFRERVRNLRVNKHYHDFDLHRFPKKISDRDLIQTK